MKLIYPKIPTRLLCSRKTLDWSISLNDSGLIVAVFRGWRSFWTALEKIKNTKWFN